MLGDRRSRTKLLAFGAVLWSLATVGSGLAASFTVLLLIRVAVGIGEAAYGTITPALLADYFPKQVRGIVFACFYAAIPVGAALGFFLGGLINHYWGWRAAFFLTGLPGLFLAVLAWRLPDPKGAAREVAPPWHGLLRNRKFLLTVLG